MQRLVLTIAAALILLNVLATPVAHADGPQSPNCPPTQLCMP